MGGERKIMIDENTIYNYKQLLEIYKKASLKAIENLNEKAKEHKFDVNTAQVFMLQNVLVISEIQKELFNGDLNE